LIEILYGDHGFTSWLKSLGRSIERGLFIELKLVMKTCAKLQTSSKIGDVVGIKW